MKLKLFRQLSFFLLCYRAIWAVENLPENHVELTARNIMKVHILPVVPNIGRYGISYQRIVKQSGSFAFVLGSSLNGGIATYDVSAGSYKVNISETYGNLGFLPGIYLIGNDNFLLGLNGIIGLQYAKIVSDSPKFLSQSETVSYQVNGTSFNLVSPHIGGEFNAYYYFHPVFFGVDIGVVAATTTSIGYSINDSGTKTDGAYGLPIVRWSGFRLAFSVGFLL